jgi:hypothetical protein
MPLMLGKLYDALRAANVPDDKAMAAAVEGASYDNRLNKLEAGLVLLQWMVGFNLILTIAIVGRLFLGH